MPINNSDIKILVACHKADANIRQDEIYLPIHVGKTLHPDIDLGFQTDNEGENISQKNGEYCELTAIYWAWKNLKHPSYVGLAHYRRYLKLQSSDITQLLSKYDWILPYRFHCQFNNFTNLALITTHEDAILAVELLKNLLPDSTKQIEEYFFQSNKYSVFNMFVTKWDLFDEYCTFLFNYLGILESILLPHSYSRLKRTIGYIAEAIMGFWMLYRDYSVKYVDTEDLNTSLFSHNLRTIARNMQRDIGFNMAFLPHRQQIAYYSAAKNALQNDGLLDKTK